VTVWLDNHLSPALARWIATEFGEPCVQVRDLGLERADDREIFAAAKASAAADVEFFGAKPRATGVCLRAI
jgi:predicted nuclease of predicted toxin-antitoxin system